MTTVSEIIRNEIISEYQESDFFLELLEALASEGDVLSEAINEVIKNRFLTFALGVNLDVLGGLVGQGRSVVDTSVQIYFGYDPDPLALSFSDLNDLSLGGVYRSADDPEITKRLLTDSEYRQVIFAAVQRNISTCTPDEIISAVLFVLGQITAGQTPPVSLIDGNTYYSVFIGRNLAPAEEAFFKDLNLLPKPAGVKVDYIDYAEGEYFGFLADPNAKGFGSITPVIYSVVILAEIGLGGYWRLGDAGPSFVDQVAARNFTAQGSYTSGIPPLINNAQLDLSISLSGAANLDHLAGQLNAAYENPEISIEAWFIVDSFGSMIGGYHTATTNDSGGYALGISPSGLLRFYTGLGAGSGNVLGQGYVEAPGVLNTGQIYHALATYDSGATGRIIYLDGVQVFQDNPGGSLDYASYGIARRMLLGQGFLNGVEIGAFDGTLDEFAVYSSVISPPSVLAHYSAGSGAPLPPVPVGWSLVGANYDNVFFETSNETIAPIGSFIRVDGTRIYISADVSNERLYEYELTVPGELSSMVYNGISFSLSTWVANPRDVYFRDDGTRMYIVDYGTDRIFEFDLGVAWDITTLVHNGVTFNTLSEDTSMVSIEFTTDGTRMFLLGENTDTIYQYDLNVAWDLSSVQPVSASFNVNSEASLPRGIFLRPNGERLFLSGSSGTIFEYDMSTPNDLSTMAYNGISLSVASEASVINDVMFSNNGLIMYTVTNNFPVSFLYQYTLPVTN